MPFAIARPTIDKPTDDLLFPSHEHKFYKQTISLEIWAWMQRRALSLLNNAQQVVHVSVRQHWEKIIKGKIPFKLRLVDYKAPPSFDEAFDAALEEALNDEPEKEVEICSIADLEKELNITKKIPVREGVPPLPGSWAFDGENATTDEGKALLERIKVTALSGP